MTDPRPQLANSVWSANNILPIQTGKDKELLTTDGTNVFWSDGLTWDASVNRIKIDGTHNGSSTTLIDSSGPNSTSVISLPFTAGQQSDISFIPAAPIGNFASLNITSQNASAAAINVFVASGTGHEGNAQLNSGTATQGAYIFILGPDSNTGLQFQAGNAAIGDDNCQLNVISYNAPPVTNAGITVNTIGNGLFDIQGSANIGKTTSKVGFYSVAPIVRQANITPPALTGTYATDFPLIQAYMNAISTFLQTIGLTL
jgi:hypothetical protein